jgi:adenosine deaminase
VKATEDAGTLELLRRRGTVLEVCPTSNLHTGVVKDLRELKRIFRALKEYGIRYTLNTDGPEMLRTNLRGEIDFLLQNGMVSEEEVLRSNCVAFDASFVK